MNQCPICKNIDTKQFLSKVNLVFGTEYSLVECPECGVIYFDPMPSEEELGIFYSGSYFNFSRWHDEAKGYLFAHKLTKIRNGGNFLDVGSALGFFIHGIKQNSNWNVFGIEFSNDAVVYSTNKLGLNVKQGELQNAEYPSNFFDYIHINNVLEHVRDPKTLLLECRRIIKNGGHLFLSVPNGFNDSRNIIDFYNSEKLPAKSISGHIYFFQTQTLSKLFNEIGFEIVNKKTGSIKRGMRNIEYLPKKKNWKKEYFPRTLPEEINKNKFIISDEKKYSDLYYRYRYFQSKFHNIPGLYKFGLDFIFLLRPNNKNLNYADA